MKTRKSNKTNNFFVENALLAMIAPSPSGGPMIFALYDFQVAFQKSNFHRWQPCSIFTAVTHFTFCYDILTALNLLLPCFSSMWHPFFYTSLNCKSAFKMSRTISFYSCNSFAISCVVNFPSSSTTSLFSFKAFSSTFIQLSTKTIGTLPSLRVLQACSGKECISVHSHSFLRKVSETSYFCFRDTSICTTFE